MPRFLGIHWNTTSDVFCVAVSTLDEGTTPTKRNIASAVAHLYDVLSPVTLYLKIVLQKLWQLQITWDETIPEELHKPWQDRQRKLPSLAKHPIQKKHSINESPILESQLQSFSDASSVWYGGVAYLRLLNQDSSVAVAQVTSKSKAMTIPKLELCGAILTAPLLVRTAMDLGISATHLYAWTDPAIVLG